MGRESKKEGTYVNMYLIHFAVEQKLTQHCKATLLQLKKILRDFTGSPVVRTPSFHCRGLGSIDLWSGKEGPAGYAVWPKKRKNLTMFLRYLLSFKMKIPRHRLFHFL